MCEAVARGNLMECPKWKGLIPLRCMFPLDFYTCTVQNDPLMMARKRSFQILKKKYEYPQVSFGKGKLFLMLMLDRRSRGHQNILE